MIVDVHTHIWDSPQQLGQEATERIRRSRPNPWARPDASLAAHHQAMEPAHAAIVLGFISCRLGASVTADQIARCVSNRPDKYVGFAGVDPMAGGVRDQVDALVELGLSGVTISPGGQDFHPSHTVALELYDYCQELGLPILVHPGAEFSSGSVMKYSQPHLFDDVAREFPQLRLVIAQVGHPWVEPTLALIGKHQNVWADLSDLVLRPWQLFNTLLAAHQQGVIDRLLLGSDFPFCTPEQAITTIYSINTYTHGTHLPNIPRKQLRRIIERDALSCLGLHLACAKSVDTRDVQGETEHTTDSGAMESATRTVGHTPQQN